MYRSFKRYFLPALVSFLAFATPPSYASPDTYYLLQTLSYNDGYPSRFGADVAASGDTIVIGDPARFNFFGGANVYVRNNGVWSLQQRLVIPWAGCLSNVRCFGHRVAIDHDTIVVGGDMFALAFFRSGTEWSIQGGVEAPNEWTMGFIEDLALEGDRAAITGYSDDQLVWVPELGRYLTYTRRAIMTFSRSGETWAEEQSFVFGGLGLYAFDPIALGRNQLFLSRGDTFVFGLPQATLEQQLAGATTGEIEGSIAVDGDYLAVGSADKIVRIYVRSATGWSLQKELASSEGGAFGRSIAIRNDLLVVGATGSVYLYRRSGTDWIEFQSLSPPVAGSDFGAAVAAGDDFAVVGAVNLNGGFGQSWNDAYVFGLDRIPPVISEPVVYGPILWPPDHRFRDMVVSYSTTDCCGAVTESLSVTSNEPVNGPDDGDTAPDWEVIDAHNLRLRAERAGSGTARVYTITITATDASGNSSTRTATVSVPRSAP